MPRKLTNRLRIVRTENLEARTLLSASMVSCVAEAAVDSEVGDTSEPENSDDSSLNQEQSTAADNTNSSDLLEDELNCEITEEQDTSDSDTSDSEDSDQEDCDATGSTEEDGTEENGLEDNAEPGDEAAVPEAAEEEEGDLVESCVEASAEDLDAYSQSTTELADSGSEPADEASVIEDGKEDSLLDDSNEPVEICPDDTTDVEENRGESLATNDETPSAVDENGTDTALTTPTDSCAPEEMLAGNVLADESTKDIAQDTDDLPDKSEEIASDVQNCLENGNSDQLASQSASAESESDETVGMTSSDEQTDESQIATQEEETVSEETALDAPSPSAFAWLSEDAAGTAEDTEDEGAALLANAAESAAAQFDSVESDSEFASSEAFDSADATSLASTASTERQDLTAMANCEAEEPNDEPDADDSTAELLAAGDLDAACQCPDQNASEDTESAETSLPSDVDAYSQTLLASSIAEQEDVDAIGQPDVELGTLSGRATAFASDASMQRASSSESEIA